MLRNTSQTYGWIAISLHWLTALVVFGQFGLGLWMVELSYYDRWYHDGPAIHKAIGVLLFFGVVARLLWRLVNPTPQPLPNHHALERLAARFMHALLYLLLLAVMISGYLMSSADGRPISVFGWFQVPATLTGLPRQEDIAGDLHAVLAWALVILAGLHAMAALKHHFFDKDDTLRRMLGMSPRHPVNQPQPKNGETP